MPEEEADTPDAEEGEEEEEEEGAQPGEVDEINEDTIKQLAAAAAGGDDAGGDDDEDEDEEDVFEADSGGGNADIKIEKLKSSIDMLKEQNGSTTDRLQTLSETLGEIRQMVHEQETKFNELEVDVDKVSDQMGDLEPQKISKRMNELESEIEASQASVQKVESRLDRVAQTANDTQDTLKRLGSMDNLLEMNKEFEQKLDEIKEAERYIERLAAKSEKINIQINKKLTEYSTYKARVDTIQEKVNDMFKKLDETSIEVKDAVKEDELEEVRAQIKELDEQLEEYGKIAPLANMALPEPIAELREERQDIEAFLEELERRRERGGIDESEYTRIKEANEEKLQKIRKHLVREWKNLEGVDEDGGDAASGGGGSGGDESAEGEEGESEEETTADKFEELVEKSVAEVQAEVREKNMDIDKVIEAEENGKGRDTLIDWLENKQAEEEAEDEEEIDYEELVEKSPGDIKKAVKSKDLDLTELLKAERNNQNRNDLLEWVENKLAEG